ncbi:S1 RNA-binding domain-containing protein [Bacillus thuringiensis]|uniref:S1 RNA-binding domain-containing protein n=1 Tax=Bacillus thuringiensis TaxID=1428 RepID=UPI0011A73B91|nr:S1 RNA-binding domain-containing protein [Bacillus thuringiensis]
MEMTKIKEAIEKGTVFSGVVRLVQRSELLNTDILMTELNGMHVIIAREEVDMRDVKTSLVNYIGTKVSFVILSVDEENGVLIASRKLVQEKKRDALIAQFESGAEFEAKITKLLRFGAYFEIGGVTVLLRNADFAEGYTAINEVKKVGDVVKVKLAKVTKNKRILVQAVEKYKTESAMSIDKFEPNQVVLGRIRSVKPWGCFVCISENIDALCPIPGTFEVEEDMRVRFRITQVREEEEKVRGKIINILPDEIEE